MDQHEAYLSGRRPLQHSYTHHHPLTPPTTTKTTITTNNSTSNDQTERIRCCIGIDEAGRGPVLGPMVYAAAYCPVDEQKTLLKAHGVNDSKQLSEENRDASYATMLNDPHLGCFLRILAPQDISSAMLRRTKYSLNDLSHDAAIGLVTRIIALPHITIDELYVDTVGPPEKYEAKLKTLFPSIQKICVRKKADSLFPIVSAASIFAKVTRDKILANWMFREPNLDPTRQFGSGYPGDPKTKLWLQQHCDPVFGFPGIIRFSWSTAETLLQKLAHDARWPSMDDQQDSSEDERNVTYVNGVREKKRKKQMKLDAFVEVKSGTRKHDDGVYLKTISLVPVVDV